jgi:uncharacterized protein YprB with RNaseH-like and TPR domain
MSNVADRLRLLRKDAGIVNAPPAPIPGTPPSRLDSLRSLLHARERGVRRPLAAPGGIEISPGVRYVEHSFAMENEPALHIPRLADEAIDRRRLLCFDTETTGLAGGVGTRAFMIGVAAWASGTLTVRQLYLTTIAGELAMLQTFAGWLREDTVLVSYNGKSYDGPLLKGRLRLNRIEHRLGDLMHADWLHPTRRAYRDVLPNCKLATVERDILKIVRDDDLPGSQAPAAWLAFLRGHSSRDLARVLVHNRQDVITLMHLGDHLHRTGALSGDKRPT